MGLICLCFLATLTWFYGSEIIAIAMVIITHNIKLLGHYHYYWHFLSSYLVEFNQLCKDGGFRLGVNKPTVAGGWTTSLRQP